MNLTLVVNKRKNKKNKPIRSNQIGSLSKSYQSVIKSVGDETRFQILLLLKKGPKTVPQISTELKRKRYDFYYHLKFLERQGIIKSKLTKRSTKKNSSGKNKRKTYFLTSQGQDQLREFSQLIVTGKM